MLKYSSYQLLLSYEKRYFLTFWFTEHGLSFYIGKTIF